MSDTFNLFREKWLHRYMDLAGHVATWSKDPSSKIGAVVVNNKGQILSLGYNGFPRGISDDSRLKDREKKYKMVVHAEMNCIYNASNFGVSLHGASIFINGLPVCSDCAKGIIQVGIKNVFCKFDNASDKWIDSFMDSKELLKEANLNVFII